MRGPESIASLDHERARFEEDVVRGLSTRPRSLPCKYLYDERGSRLFDRITTLDEYYLTRAETALLHAHAREIATRLGRAIDLVELGSGSSVKTRILLDALIAPARYVPIDISAKYLAESARKLSASYPSLRVEPRVADYARPMARFAMPRIATRRVVFFPGSSIGNFEPDEAIVFLDRARTIAGSGGVVIVGVDLPKDASVIEPAYDDAQGVTAAFNQNLLVRINRELGGDFDLDAFVHRAPWDASRRRVEMQLVSTRAQTVRIAGRRFAFEQDEVIVTEHCYKHGIEDFRAMARAAGLGGGPVWTDPEARVSLHWLDA
ncbi:L-histidine N(alpha)-methyltransferase [Sandaracinus amylolyticus]|uniref:ABC transporter ATP-binding protein n=1 Tax=Sandaracinus amylolyticus TaxID=927083 RepID=A0A0F6YKU6_9BACT|nr:L-histidine N(alpha)-methyltransferase [Sandaracinus amylolyticus]AKF08795.1 ABC transporter ATP-binding protein [Sandaracinus amylolyticus]